jgi:protease I
MLRKTLRKSIAATVFTAFAATGALGAASPASEPLVPTLDTTLLTTAATQENARLGAFLDAKPQDPQALAGKRIALLTTDGVESIELTAQLKYFRDRGASIDVVAPKFTPPEAKWGLAYPSERRGHILTVRYMDNAQWVKIDRYLESVTPDDYDAVIIAGGTWNPDTLRILPQALDFVRGMAAAGKVTAAICHGPLVFVNAGLLKGKVATATWNVQLDIQNAGAKLVDAPVAVDGKLITSRHPLDLPDFLPAIEGALKAN